MMDTTYNVGIYCRLSNDDERDGESVSIENQKLLLQNYVRQRGWNEVDVYIDEGITGTSAEKRPDFQRLLADCHRGRVDKVLVKSVSRFARNARDCLSTIRELKSIGVGVCFEEQHIDTSNMSGELLTAVFAAMAQRESQNISENMRWSYQRRMQSGQFITCSAPFGYRLKEDGKLAVNEPEADVVRMIFERYLAGQSKDDIAEYVSTLCIPTREGNLQWKHKAIAYILSNERYVGDALLQKKFTTDTLPFKQRINRGEKEQYFVPQSHPAIIDRETFDAVAALLSRRTFTMPHRESNPLALKIFCRTCGNSFRRAVCGQKTYWVCRQHHRSKDSCPSGRIPEDEIHAAFLRVYHKLRLHGEPILKQMLSDLQSVRERRMLWSRDVVALNQKIADLSNQGRMLADMNKCGLVDPDIFISQSNELARQLRAAKQEKERLLADGDDDAIPRTRELLETMEALPEFLPAFDGEIFADLVERITAEGDGALRFRLKNGLELAETTERSVR